MPTPFRPTASLPPLWLAASRGAERARREAFQVRDWSAAIEATAGLAADEFDDTQLRELFFASYLGELRNHGKPVPADAWHRLAKHAIPQGHA